MTSDLWRAVINELSIARHVRKVSIMAILGCVLHNLINGAVWRNKDIELGQY